MKFAMLIDNKCVKAFAYRLGRCEARMNTLFQVRPHPRPPVCREPMRAGARFASSRTFQGQHKRP